MPKRTALLALITIFATALISAQQQPPAPARPGGIVPAPDRRAGEGVGPFQTMVIRSVMVIDGTGAPPFGPMDVVVENNRIAAIRSAGTPGMPLRPHRPPTAQHEIADSPYYVGWVQAVIATVVASLPAGVS